ncbi:gamma-glutamylcyclotransferase family protein [Thermovibrio sp.]
MTYELLFVYGTLMSGFSAHAFLMDSQFISHGILYGARLIHLPQGFPGALEGEGEVIGEVYRVDSLTLKAIDAYEDYNEEFENESLFIRKLKPIKLIPLNEWVEAWVYIFNEKLLEEFTEIPLGNWREFIEKLL